MTFTVVHRRTWAAIAAAFGTFILGAAAFAGHPAVQGYTDHVAHQLVLQSIAKSKLATLESLGTSKGGREVFLLTIGTGKTDAKPALLVVGNVHPPHLLGSELATRLARRIVDWQPIEHPDFPDRKVEVGGFKPFLRTNPPADQLEPLAERHSRFVRELVEMFPRLEISELKAEPLGSGVWRVTAAVVNRGRLPTMSQMGRTSRQLQGLQMQITLSRGASLVTGYPRVGISPLGADGGRREKSWLVTAPSGKPASARVRVWSPSAGSQVKSIKLERQ